MSLTRCPFCEYSNAVDAKFCAECGGALHLAPCPKCGAVNQVTSSVCYQCHSQLSGRATAAPAPTPTPSLPVDFLSESLPVAVVPQSLPRRRSRVIIDAVLVVAIAALGYNAYQQHRYRTEAPQLPAASSEPGSRVPPAGTVSRGVVAVPAGTGAGFADAATLPSKTSLAAPARAAMDQPRGGRQPAESQKAAAAVPAAARRPPAVGAGKGSAPGPFAREACTEAGAALGLCVMSPSQKKAPEKAAAVSTATATPAAPRRGAGGQEPNRPQECTEAVAALGLCAPGTTQRRE